MVDKDASILQESAPARTISARPRDSPTIMNTPTKRKHPHFDDRGTLDWHTSFAGALKEAQRDKKRLFIEIGREL